MDHATLTPDLFFDLIDRRLTAIDICSRHDLTFDQLEAIVQSQAFQANIARLQSVEHTRSSATDTLRRTAALRTLEDIAAQQPTSPTHTETIRLAAAQILRVTNADPHAALDPSTEPDPTDPSRTPPHQHNPHTDPHQAGDDFAAPYPPPNPDTPRFNTHARPKPTPQDQHRHQPPCNPPQDVQPGTNPGPHTITPPAPTQEPRTQPIQSPTHKPAPKPQTPRTEPTTAQSTAQNTAAVPHHANNSNPAAHPLITRAGGTQPIPSSPLQTHFPETAHQRSPPPQHAA